MSKPNIDKRRTHKVHKVHKGMIEVYMNIFGVSREDAIAALQVRGLTPSSDDSDKEDKE